ncbi:MAG: phosphotransferase family protein [Promethearchaeota archaeon]
MKYLKIHLFSKSKIRIYDLTKFPDGWETEVYSLKIRKNEDQGMETLVLRIYPMNGTEKVQKEFFILKKLHECGYPVPKALLLEINHSPIHNPFIIMEQVIGRRMWFLSQEASPEKKQELLTVFCKLFINLHSLDWKLFVPDPSIYDETPYGFINRELSVFRKIITRYRKFDFLPVLDWLEERKTAVPCYRQSLLHMDFHGYNVLVTTEEKAFVIDWGFANIGDFRYDLAMALLIPSTYGYPETRNIILKEYERIKGRKIEYIEYFDVLVSVRRLLTIAIALKAGAEKIGLRKGAETMIREGVNHIKGVHTLLTERTGLIIPEIQMFTSRFSKLQRKD